MAEMGLRSRSSYRRSRRLHNDHRTPMILGGGGFPAPRLDSRGDHELDSPFIDIRAAVRAHESPHYFLITLSPLKFDLTV